MTYFLNGLWQGAALTIIMWALLKLLKPLSAATRYAIWWIVLLAVVLLPLRSLLPERPTTAPQPEIPRNVSRAVTLFSPMPSQLNRPVALIVSKPSQPSQLTIKPSRSSPLFPFKLPAHPVTDTITIAWIALSLILLARLVFSFHALRRLKVTADESPESLQSRLLRIAANARIHRRGRLLVSHEITGPLALGFLDPVILIPSSMADEPPSEEFDHAILHELSHLARFDDWTNLLQQLLLALLPIQPALFWIGRQLNLERETACDDRVISVTGSPKPYAAFLTRVAELALWHHSALLASGAGGSHSHLYRRIHRLLERRASKKAGISPIPLLAVITAVVCLFSLTFSAPLLIALTDSPSVPQAPRSNSDSPTMPAIPDIAPTNLPPVSGTQFRSITSPPGETLSLDIDRGNVKIDSSNQNQVQFKITQTGKGIDRFLQHHQISIGRTNHEILLHAIGDGTPDASNSSLDIEYEITVPAKFDVHLKNESGNAQLSNLSGTLSTDIQAGNVDADSCAGALDASTTAGNVTLHQMTAKTTAITTAGNVKADNCGGPMSLSSHAGNINLEKMTGDVTVRADAGNIISDDVAGPMDASSSAGNLMIRRFTGPYVKAHASMGNVTAEIDSQPKSDCSLTTNMGNVDASLINSAAVTFNISAAMGNLEPHHLGAVNGGGPEIRAASQMGNVTIHRN